MNIPQPVIFVLFGATGDLARKKIMLALFKLYCQNELPKEFAIIAVSRRPWNTRQYHEFIQPSLGESLEDLEDFFEHIAYIDIAFGESAGFEALQSKIEEYEKQWKEKTQKIFHLSIHSDFYKTAIEDLRRSGLNTADSKIIIEKPIGQDLNSAIDLEKLIQDSFSENQIYRIDHYFGKPGLDRMIRERSENSELENRLNNNYVKSVHVRLLETIDIEGRGEFYDSTGTLRDVVQNHALEMMTVLAMDLNNGIPVSSRRGEIIKDITLDVSLPKEQQIIRAQYEGYKNEKGVFPESETETYIKLRMLLNNKSWTGVPFILEAGKALPERKIEIEVVFKDGTKKVFDIRNPLSPDAYEVLIADVIRGEKDRFVSHEELLRLWNVVMPVLENLKKVPLYSYQKGSCPVIN
jgi:glucose-6-phosphate 1-dehydrogenase